MKITTKLAVEYLKKNKVRTIGTVIAVILVTIIITTLLTIFMSYQNFRENIVRSKGNWDAEFLCVKYSDALEIEKDKNIKEVSIWYDYGMSEENLINSKTTVHRIHLFAYDENKLKNSGVYLKEGKMPENSNEIIISERAALYELDGEKAIGDKLKMTFEGETKEYTIVGIAEEIEEGTQNKNFSDGKDIRIGAITLLKNSSIKNETIVNLTVLMSNIYKIYDTTKSLEEKLELDKIPNISKVTIVDRAELDKIDSYGLEENIQEALSQFGISHEIPIETQENPISAEKIIYNDELLQELGISNTENTSYDTFILIRNNLYINCIICRNCTNIYFIQNNL